ncbi:MAG TPA: hypothetical protein VL020_01245 [Pseudomonadales bacterium]|nr:hypothetical protein [Pseudomonadales bacterium]
MSKRVFIGVFTLLCMPLFALGISVSVVEPVEPNAQQQRIVEIIDLSGLTGLSLQARHLAQQALNETAAPLGKQYEVVGAIAAVWAPDKLQKEFEKILNGYSSAQLEQLTVALRSQHLLLAREKEHRAVSEQNSESYERYMQRINTNKVSEGRMSYIRDLDSAMQFSAMLLQTRQSVYAELQQNLGGWQPQEQWQQSLRNDVNGFLLYVHRDTSNEELQRLSQVYKQPQLQTWLKQVGQVLQHKR